MISRIFTLTTVLSIAVTASAFAYDPAATRVAQKLETLYPGTSAGDVGLPCDPQTGAFAFGRARGGVPCVVASFRASDAEQAAGFTDALQRFDAKITSDRSALAKIEGIWVHLTLDRDIGPQPGVSVHN